MVRRGPFTLRIPRLELAAGRVACVVGANGSGKTTLLEVIMGLLTATKGVVEISGRPLTTIATHPYLKRFTGFLPDDEAWIIPELTADEYVSLLSVAYRRAGVEHDPGEEARSLAKSLDFNAIDQQLGSLSHGNRRKIQLITAMMHRPRFLVVDELRNGLDPIAIRQAEDLLRIYQAKGGAILAATHDLWWAERFADDIIMIKNGRVILQATTTAIVAEAGSVEAKFMELYK